MLELIVLGEVPGTRFVITFSWVVAFGTIAVGMGLFRRAHKHGHNQKTGQIEEISL